MKEIRLKQFRGEINVLKDEKEDKERRMVFEIILNIKDVDDVEELIALHSTIKNMRDEDWRGLLDEIYREEGIRYTIVENASEKSVLDLSRKRTLSNTIVVSLKEK